MNAPNGTAEDLVDLIKRRAPAYLDLLTARNNDEFEVAFDAILAQAVDRLETNKKNYATLDEEALSATLGGFIWMPGLSVTQETNSNGHVDLTIEATYSTPTRRKLGEAKIYAGPAYHFKGLEQLLDRYTTGREGRGLLIIYVRSPDIAGLMKKLSAKMDTDLPCSQQGATTPHCLKWSFLSTHAHSCGEDVAVGHIGCNLAL